MIINRLLKINLIILSVVFIALSVFEIDMYVGFVSATILIAFAILYIRLEGAQKKSKPYFLLFIIFFLLSELIGIINNYVYLEENAINYGYYLGNLFYMIAYVFLILRCVVTMKITYVLKNFPITLIILVVLSIFCVTLITETVQNQLNAYEYALEFSYNVVVMILLSVALINYMDKSDNKSMLFLIACMFIFFSEMLQLAYYYIQDLPYLAAIYSLFMVLAFVFFYHQSRLKHQKQPDLSFIDNLS